MIIGCLLAFCKVNNVCGQLDFWDVFIESISTQENLESEEWAKYMEELNEWHEHPLNINTATKEDLARFSFLTAEQVEAVLAYIYRYGPMKTLGELQLISELDYESRNFLCLFVYIGPVEENTNRFQVKNLLKSGKHTLITRMDIPLYQRDGFKSYSDEELLKNPNKKYLGNALYHSLRYGYVCKNRIFWGFGAEKESGEPFGNYGNWSYDAFSFHFFCRDYGYIKTLALGDYKLSFGEGVVLNTGFSLGKSDMPFSSCPQGIRRHASVAGDDVLRGAAATINWGKVDISFFYSRQKRDATLTGKDSVSALRKEGYHRTLSEIERKHNLTAQLAGGNVTGILGKFRLGFTGYYLHYNKTFVTGGALYRQYHPQGRNFGVGGVNYAFRGYRLFLSGETAYSSNRNGWATLNKASYRINGRYRLMLLQRFYSYKYHSFYGAAFAEESSLRNESGWYAGLESCPLDYLHVTAYVDFFYSPWPRYTMTHSSAGQEGALQLRYTGSKKMNVLFRYRIKNKEKSDVRYFSHRMKMQMNYMPFRKAETQTTLLLHCRNGKDHRKSRGYGCVQTVKYKAVKDRMHLSLSGAYFDTDDYESRLYFYEPGLLYTFYYPAYYGRGVRTAVRLRRKWNNWMLIGKYGFTHYFDRDEIGSGTQRIPHSSQSDISMQLKCEF